MTINSNRVRGLQFQIVADKHRKNPDAEIILPKRATIGAAAYDFFCPVDTEVAPFGKTMIWTDVKAQIPNGLMLMINVRSSMGKYGIRMANTQGWVDSDYYSNPSNDGNIGILLENNDERPFKIKAGDRVAQGMFVQYYVTSDDNVITERTGGFGSTNS